MKNITRLIAATALCVTASHAAPFLAIDDNAEIFLTGSVGVRADSNIYLSPSDTDDTVIDFSPGFQLVFGQSALVQGSLTFTENITRFSSHDELNDSLSSVGFNTNYDDGKSKLTFNTSFNELNQNSVDTTANADFLIRRDVFAIGGTGEVSVTEKSSVSVGVQYQQSDYELGQFSDSRVVTLPVNYYYEVSAKVDASFGYRYRQRWESIGFDTKDHFISVGARGEFTPKLSGQVAVGVTQRSFEHKAMRLDDKSLLGLDATLVYLASPKTSVQFGVSNDFDTNSQGQQQKNFVVRLSASTKISAEWSVTTGISYRSINYYTRIDDYFEGHIGATYTVSNNVSVTGALSFRSNESDLVSSNFDAHVFSLAANFRF